VTARTAAWRASAVLATLLPAWVLVDPTVRAAVRDFHLAPIAIAGLGALLIGAWAAPRLAGRSVTAALFSLAAGWTGFGLMAALAWPRIPPATALHDFSAAAAAAAREPGATVVGYQTYIQGLPLALRSPVPVAAYTGELEPQFEPDPRVRESLFWTREKFWSEWKSGKKLIAVVRRSDVKEFQQAGVPARVLASAPKHVLIANAR
jgi:hypothetical protein